MIVVVVVLQVLSRPESLLACVAGEGQGPVSCHLVVDQLGPSFETPGVTVVQYLDLGIVWTEKHSNLK